MKLDFNWINLLILFGAIQGLVFSIILLFNKRHPGAIFLSVFMFALAYNGFETFNWSSGLDKYYIFLHMFPFVIIYSVGPSLYLYVTSLLYPERRLSSKTILAHYSIVGFQFTFRSVEIIYHLLWINNVFRGPITNDQVEQIYWTYSEPLSVMVFIGYLIATIYEFRKVKAFGSIKSVSKENKALIFKWVKALLVCMVILGIAWPATVTALHFVDVPDNAYYPIELGLVLFIYWIAFTGYHKTKQIYLKDPKIKAGAITDAEAETFFSQLKGIMENEKLYLDPELNLNKVASLTGTNPKIISKILNQYQQTNFNDFINHYRVRDVKGKLIEPNFQHLTISAIALESGFNSQATFQRAFKNSTGMTPKEYMNLRLKNMA
jgi:AraC-like DNA-binding protein